MRFRNGNINDLLEQIKDKILVVFGVNEQLVRILKEFESYGLYERVGCVTDVLAEANATYEFNGIKKPFYMFDWFTVLVRNHGEYVLLISDLANIPVFIDRRYKIPENTMFYIGDFLLHYPPTYQLPLRVLPPPPRKYRKFYIMFGSAGTRCRQCIKNI